MHDTKKALYSIKRALCLPKRTLYSSKRALQTHENEPTKQRGKGRCGASECSMQKELYILSKEPYILSKEPYILSKETYIFPKETYKTQECWMPNI